MMTETSERDTFLGQLFECEYCHECGGDTQHHQVTFSLFNLPFAMCLFPPDEDTGNFHPTIAAFRKTA